MLKMEYAKMPGVAVREVAANLPILIGVLRLRESALVTQKELELVFWFQRVHSANEDLLMPEMMIP